MRVRVCSVLLVFLVLMQSLVVSAAELEEETYQEYYGNFLGEQYPIYTVESDISTFAILDSYKYNLYYYYNSEWFGFSGNGSTSIGNLVSFPELRTYRCELDLILPNDLSAGNSYSVVITGTMGKAALNILSVFWANGGGAKQDFTFDVSSLGDGYSFVFTVPYTLLSADADILFWSFDVLPVSVDWGIYLTNIDIREVSSSDGIAIDTNNKVGSILDAIINLPSKIVNGLATFFNNVVNAVNNIASSVATRFTSIFDGWFGGDDVLDNQITDGNNAIDDLNDLENNLIGDASGRINDIDFSFTNISSTLITSMGWVVLRQDELFAAFGDYSDVVIIALMLSLVTLILGRGLPKIIGGIKS